MQSTMLDQIVEQARQLPPEKLETVLDFVRFLSQKEAMSDARETMIASEHGLKRDWDRPEEDEAWRDL